MKVILYPGKQKKHLEYFTVLFDSVDQPYKSQSGYFGYKLVLSACSISIDKIADNICLFIFDNYLKESVISKVYDEYPCFNTVQAGEILTKVSEKIITTPIKNSIIMFLKDKHSINIESYCIFNLKSIMLCVYAITDKICQEMSFITEKQKFISMIRIFSDLSFEKCGRADVEFSEDNKCNISFDMASPLCISNDELLALLVQKAPSSVIIKNSHVSPQLSDIILEVFNSEKNK